MKVNIQALESCIQREFARIVSKHCNRQQTEFFFIYIATGLDKYAILLTVCIVTNYYVEDITTMISAKIGKEFCHNIADFVYLYNLNYSFEI